MSEEKMRAAFRKLFKYEMSDDAESETFARGYQAALQESEAGAVYQVEQVIGGVSYWLDVSKQLYDCETLCKKRTVSTTPQYPQAIETAAIMKCAEAMDGYWARKAVNSSFEEDMAHVGRIKEILALIPRDGRTALEEFGMKVAQEVKSATVYNECRNMLTKENELRAIVANLIGAGELSEAEYNANHSGKPINYIDKLRRMAESVKTTMEGEN